MNKKIFYKDIDKKGNVIYYRRDNFGNRYMKASKETVEFLISTEMAEIVDYVPNKPHERMTARQLSAALSMAESVDDKIGIALIMPILNQKRI